MIIPHGDTRLKPGNRLTALVELNCMPEFLRLVHGSASRDQPGQ
jgi:Trk K+ transport system NAD-binding subunit